MVVRTAKNAKVASDVSILKSLFEFFLDYWQIEKAIDINSRRDAETAEEDE
jgi:hypothetical protein